MKKKKKRERRKKKRTAHAENPSKSSRESAGDDVAKGDKDARTIGEAAGPDKGES